MHVMQVRILDLDRSLTAQPNLLIRAGRAVCPLDDWGPRLRLACSFARFARFERKLANRLGSAADERPIFTYVGSGDFHHVSLALLRRLRTPFNLLVIDNHPDWMTRVPLMHCGTWLAHAARLPLVQSIYHVGGNVDFDNGFRWLAPWRRLRSGQLNVFPAVRRWQRWPWRGVQTPPLRFQATQPMLPERIEELLRPHCAELARWPLYVSLDKDVMNAADAPVNWDSGHLCVGEVCTILEAFFRAAGERLAGMDVVGDWSPVRVAGAFRRLLHFTEHPPLAIDADAAAQQNERLNLALLDLVTAQKPRPTTDAAPLVTC
jgi:arginase family enzyme